MDDLIRLTDALNDLADKWDAALRAEYKVDGHWTDKHAVELREIVAEALADRPQRQRGGVIFGEPFFSAPRNERDRNG